LEEFVLSQSSSAQTRGPVLVTGVGGPSGKAAVTALKSAGFTVIATDMRQVDHAADLFFQIPAVSDVNYWGSVRAIIAERGVRWFFPTVSEELVLVAQEAETLRRQGVAVYVGTVEAVRICNDKWETACFLKARGVAVPASAIGSAEDAGVHALGFPRVSRPRVGRGGRGVVVHDNAGIVPIATDVIWQEFLPGTEYDVLLVRHPDAPHRILALQVFAKTVLKEGRVGNALALVPAVAPDVADLALAAATALNLCGPMDIDIRRDAHDRPKLLEVNARVGAHSLRAPAIFSALIDLFNQEQRAACST
jgi:carbamoylphosphate synthase large subunit